MTKFKNMKKTIFTLALLVMAMAAGAQTIKVNFKKGEVRKFSTSTDVSVGIPMRGETKAQSYSALDVTVSDVNPDGYTVVLKTDSFSMTGGSEVMQQFSNENYLKALKDVTAKLKLDKNGVVTDITNSDEVLGAVAKYSIEAVNKLYADHPEIEKAAPKSKALMLLNEQLTKDNLLDFLRETPFFANYGKDFKANPTADETFKDIVKLKSNYTVSQADGKTTISKTSASNMTEEDTKSFLKKQISQMMGSDVSDAEFNQVWNQVKMMGMANINVDDDAKYDYSTTGWLTSSTTSMTMKAMGATIKVNATTTAR